ncbi:hypothetical protein DB346_17365 [Verrucomicrobia bacterium LW23]|nr:hypothetical protein DB346_17365 [Verrucomicrobia bacterium LW23]
MASLQRMPAAVYRLARSLPPPGRFLLSSLLSAPYPYFPRMKKLFPSLSRAARAALVLGVAWTCVALCPLPAAAQDVENPTSNNREISVVPTPGAVVIDGKDTDWDLSAGIWSYNDPTLVKKYGVWTHMMWDDKGVYLLMRYTDNTPLKNATRGEDFHKSWQADAFQGRVVFDEKTPEEHQMHINIFHSSTEDRDYMIVKHGGFKAKPPYDGTGPDRPDQLEKFGGTMDKAGGKVALAPWADGKGYNLEAFWPWSFVRTNGQALKPGESFIFGLEAMWGDAKGERVEHRLVDNMRDDKVNRIFFFRARDGWGKAVISDKGKLDITAAQKALQEARLKQFVNYDTEGPVPITYSLPEDRDVTIAIDNEKGERVRNLIGQFPRNKGNVTDYWDGLDDKGNAVPPGTYKVTIVDHAPLTVKFVNSLYNAGTPPWATADGKKSWGSNHGEPTTVATRGDVTLCGFTGTEGAPGLLRATPEGIVMWSDVTELQDITLDDKYVYIVSRESWTKRTMVRKFDVKTGALMLFENAERSTESVLPVPVAEVKDATIAMAGGKLFPMVLGKGLWRLDPATGAIEATLTMPEGLVAVKEHGNKLYGMFRDGAIAELDADAKRGATVIAPNLLKVASENAPESAPARFNFSQDGQLIAISDHRTNQVFIYNTKGELHQTLGKAYKAEDGVRPAGKFIETNFIDPHGLAFDSKGRLWVAEAESTCRRVTVWTPEGKLDKQFWGGADYGAMAGFPLTYDSTRFVARGIEFQLDPNPDIMNRPTAEKALYFHPLLGKDRGYIYKVNGHEYAMNMPGSKQPNFWLAKRNKEGVFVPVVEVQYGNARAKDPALKEGTAWIDKNEDGKRDADELFKGVKGTSHYWTSGWMRPDLTVITADQWVYPVKSFTPGGVPIYDFANAQEPAHKITRDGFHAQGSTGTIVMDDAGNVSNGIAYATADGRTGAYPNPYGRHDAPAARRGLLIAPFRTNGVVEKVPGVGSITVLGGDRGEWFVMSMDGLYISSLFQDSKGEVTLDDNFLGQESFGGFIWRDEKGRVMMQVGGPSFRIMELHGLETTRKEMKTVQVSAEQIAAGLKLAEKKAAQRPSEPESLVIERLKNAPPTAAIPADISSKVSLIEGAETVRVQESGDPNRWFRTALAHDGKNLIVAWLVNDANPWKNGEGRFSHSFIGGDCVDLKLDVPGRGPIRVLVSPIGGKAEVTYWQSKSDKPENPTTYVVANNEGNAQKFDVVKRLEKAKVEVAKGENKYTVLLTIPLAELGIDLKTTSELKGLVGVIFSDPSGTNRASRLYWKDKTTGMVSDVPSEAKLDARNWGQIKIGK